VVLCEPQLSQSRRKVVRRIAHIGTSPDLCPVRLWKTNVFHPVRCRQRPPAPRLAQSNRSICKIAGLSRWPDRKTGIRGERSLTLGESTLSKGPITRTGSGGLAQVRFVAHGRAHMAARPGPCAGGRPRVGPRRAPAAGVGRSSASAASGTQPGRWVPVSHDNERVADHPVLPAYDAFDEVEEHLRCRDASCGGRRPFDPRDRQSDPPLTSIRPVAKNG
jgi:hypothetical protein